MHLPEPVEFHPGDDFFSRAEKMFQRKEYGNSLEIYDKYLARFPDGYRAAQALMKKGLIHTALGEYDKSYIVYNRLIAKYPSSPVVSDARVEILVTFYNQGKYNQVISHAAHVLEESFFRVHILRTYTLVGDSYMAMGSSAKALNYYLMAYTKTKKHEKEKIIFKIESAAREVDPAIIISLFIRRKDELPVEDLIYRTGLSKAEWKKYEDTVILLSEFIKRFPENENVQSAKKLIQDINEKFTFKHNILGCLLPLSGPYTSYGNKILKCIEMALDQFNSQNSRSLIKLIVKDSESDPEKAVLAVNELSEERVGAILGPVTTHEAAALEAQEKRIPIITLGQKENIATLGDYVFRNFITPEMQVQAIVSYAIQVLEINRFAILYPDDKYGTTFMGLFQDEVEAYGGEVIRAEPYHHDQTDFAEPIKKLAETQTKLPEQPEEETENSDSEPALDFEAVFIPDGPTTSGLLVPQLAFYDVVGVHLFGTNLWHSDRLIEMAKQFIQGAIMVDGFFAGSNSQKVKDFVEMFEETFDEKPGFIEAVAYDTAMILFDLVSRNDIQSRSEIKNEIMNLQDFQGVTGTTSFDNTGNAHKKLYLLQIQGDKFIEMENNS
ncbi:MAG: ABC transporter substrate-binding protein [Proteobacteria bacterium]|nr:ABC transporter substrate-binding protein [Pseudomonadota bacterium]